MDDLLDKYVNSLIYRLLFIYLITKYFKQYNYLLFRHIIIAPKRYLANI